MGLIGDRTRATRIVRMIAEMVGCVFGLRKMSVKKMTK